MLDWDGYERFRVQQAANLMLNVAEKRRNSAYLGVALLIGGSGFFILALEIYILSSNSPSPHLYCKNVLGFIGGTTNISSYTINREGELDLPGRRGQNETKSRSPRLQHEGSLVCLCLSILFRISLTSRVQLSGYTPIERRSQPTFQQPLNIASREIKKLWRWSRVLDYPNQINTKESLHCSITIPLFYQKLIERTRTNHEEIQGKQEQEEEKKNKKTQKEEKASKRRKRDKKETKSNKKGQNGDIKKHQKSIKIFKIRHEISENSCFDRSRFSICREIPESRHLGVSHKPPKNVGSKSSRKQVPSQSPPSAPVDAPWMPVDAPVYIMWVCGYGSVSVCVPLNHHLIEIAPIEWFRLGFWDISGGEKSGFTRKYGGNRRERRKRGKKRTRSRNKHDLETKRDK